MGRTVSLLTLAWAAAASGLRAQTATPDARWEARLGAAAGFHVACSDCEAPRPGGGFTLGVGRAPAEGLGWGVGWTSTWLAGRHSGQHRHDLEATLTRTGRGAVAPFLRVGAGLTLATLVTVDGPPPPPGVGDVVVAIGDWGGVGASVAGGLRIGVGGPWAVAPEARLHVQRLGGQQMATLSLSVGVHAR